MDPPKEGFVISWGSADASATERSVTPAPPGTRALDRRPRLAQHLATAIVVIVFVGGAVNLVVTLLESSIGPVTAAYGV
ncbi:MAG: hypothetical protein ACRDZY_13535, partial [Acidimicrobiales bacterium]